MRLMIVTCIFSLMSFNALAQTDTPPKKHLLIYRTEQGARQRCPNDQIVWASTTTHTLYLPRDKHFAHTHGGYVCESEARALGYRGPTSHA